MTPGDLVFLASFLFVVVLCARLAIAAIRQRLATVRRTARVLALFVAAYTLVLISVSLARPRRLYNPGERRCFDDWCITVLDAKLAEPAEFPGCGRDPGARTWVVITEVSSMAKRIRQRARDARVELEDDKQQRHSPCAAPSGTAPQLQRSFADELGPGEAFRVLVPFRLAQSTTPRGLIVHHGDFPGVAIIGADQSFLHPPALHQLGSPIAVVYPKPASNLRCDSIPYWSKIAAHELTPNLHSPLALPLLTSRHHGVRTAKKQRPR